MDSELDNFARTVGNARQSLLSPGSNSSASQLISDASRQAIIRASDLGATLAQGITTANAVADEHDWSLQGSAVTCTLPRLPNFHVAGSLHEAIGLPGPFLPQQFGKILERCVELHSVVLPAARQQARQAEMHHAAARASYLSGIWQSLREFSLKHYVDDHDLQEVAQATGQMFDQGAFA